MISTRLTRWLLLAGVLLTLTPSPVWACAACFGESDSDLARGSFAAGNYSRKWDGRTDRGGRAEAGVFFYRLKVGSETYGFRPCTTPRRA